MRIYLACTVRGDRGGVSAGRIICEHLLRGGHDVLTSHLLDDDVENAESQLTEADVFRRDLEWLAQCDVLLSADQRDAEFVRERLPRARIFDPGVFLGPPA